MAGGADGHLAQKRHAELLHGLVSMAYITLFLIGKLPGYPPPSPALTFADSPTGLGAISKVPVAGWAQIVAYCAFCKLPQGQCAGTAAAACDFGLECTDVQ